MLKANIRFPNGTIAAEVEKPSEEGKLEVICPVEG